MEDSKKPMHETAVKKVPHPIVDFPMQESMFGPKTIPAVNVFIHENQCLRNHGQSVHRLAERGGLCWSELFAVLHDLPWRSMNELEAFVLSTARMEQPFEKEMQGRLLARFARAAATPILPLETKPAAPSFRLVWLNLADGTFSESWLEGEHPPESSMHESKLAQDARNTDPMYKLIKNVCLSDSNFAFDHHMRLR